jgi:hypothetical protein
MIFTTIKNYLTIDFKISFCVVEESLYVCSKKDINRYIFSRIREKIEIVELVF